MKWFNPAKSYGFVTVAGKSKDLLFHTAGAERGQSAITITQTQAVRVSTADGRKGEGLAHLKLA